MIIVNVQVTILLPSFMILLLDLQNLNCRYKFDK